MNLPQDTPVWLIRILDGLQERLENEVRSAVTADAALKASGAFGLWAVIREEVNIEYERQSAENRDRVAALISGRERTAEN